VLSTLFTEADEAFSLSTNAKEKLAASAISCRCFRILLDFSIEPVNRVDASVGRAVVRTAAPIPTLCVKPEVIVNSRTQWVLRHPELFGQH
jgi:hypothetical protein